MANNRIFLVHTPSGKRITLGKRMAGGYYSAPTKEQMNNFFDECDDAYPYDFDDFELEFETEPNKL